LATDTASHHRSARRRWKKARDKGKDKANKRRRHAWREYFIGRRRIDANWQEGTYALRTLTGHDNQLYCVQFDEDKIVSGSEDETMKGSLFLPRLVCARAVVRVRVRSCAVVRVRVRVLTRGVACSVGHCVGQVLEDAEGPHVGCVVLAILARPFA
jgi:hypothetical protein